MSMSRKKFLFYYEPSNIGGAQLLLARLAEYLIKQHEDVVLLRHAGKPNSFIQDFLDEKQYKYQKCYVSQEEKYIGKEIETLIVPLPTVFELNKILSPESKVKIFQWDTHPTGVISNLAFGGLINRKGTSFTSLSRIFESKKYKRLRNFLKVSNNKGSLVFMCGTNFELNKTVFNLDFTPTYLPLPIKIDSENPNQGIIADDNSINISWLGRIDSVKSQLIEMVIKDCLEWNRSKETKIRFHIVGDGSHKEYLEKRYEDSQIIFHGIIKNEYVGEFYQKNKIEITLNVGTSALESASHGLHSVLLPGLECIPHYANTEKRYLPLFEVVDYDVSIKKNNQYNLRTFEELLQEGRQENTLKELKLNSFKYVLQSHKDDQVFENFMQQLNATTLNYLDICSLNIFDQSTVQKIKKRLS